MSASLNCLKVCDGLTELLALGHVARAGFERGARNAHGLRRNAQAPVVERAQRIGEALALLAHQAIGRHAAVVEHDLQRGRSPQPHLVFLLGEMETGQIGGEDEGADALAATPRVGAVGARHAENDLRLVAV
jgi:hypothetical protein